MEVLKALSPPRNLKTFYGVNRYGHPTHGIIPIYEEKNVFYRLLNNGLMRGIFLLKRMSVRTRFSIGLKPMKLLSMILLLAGILLPMICMRNGH